MKITQTVKEMLLEVSLAEIRARASKSAYEILQTNEQKKLAEIRLNEFQYKCRELREILDYVEKEIEFMKRSI